MGYHEYTWCNTVPGVNLTAPTGQCWEGYYCVSGSDRPNPLMLNDTQCPEDSVHAILGHACPTGHYCPVGSDYPIPCEPGTYQDTMQQGNCTVCPLGHYCYANTSDYTTNICPAGYYCPLRTADMFEHPCPAGTFNNLTQQHSAEACQSCNPGEYCQGAGNAYPTAMCDEGWYCTNGSDSARVSEQGAVHVI